MANNHYNKLLKLIKHCPAELTREKILTIPTKGKLPALVISVHPIDDDTAIGVTLKEVCESQPDHPLFIGKAMEHITALSGRIGEDFIIHGYRYYRNKLKIILKTGNVSPANIVVNLSLPE